MNGREAAAWPATAPSRPAARELAERAACAGLARGVITAGSAAVTGFDADGMFHDPAAGPQSIADVTGAGDALAGVTIAAMMHGMPLRAALREGIAAAVLTIASPKAGDRDARRSAPRWPKRWPLCRNREAVA